MIIEVGKNKNYDVMTVLHSAFIINGSQKARP